MHPFCWIFQHPLSPYSHCTWQKLGEFNFSWQEPSAATVGNSFQQRWWSFLSLSQLPVCCWQRTATCSLKQKHRGRKLQRFRNTSLGQTVNCTVALITKSTINLFRAEVSSFANTLSSINLWQAPSLTNNLQCNVTAYCTTAQITGLSGLTERRDFVAYLKVFSAV